MLYLANTHMTLFFQLLTLPCKTIPVRQHRIPTIDIFFRARGKYRENTLLNYLLIC